MYSRASVYAKLEASFIRVIGHDAIDKLRRAGSGTRILTVGGDQLTGKSTLSRVLATRLNATYISAGTVFRMTAKEKGVSVAELSRLAQLDKDIDVRIEYATCLAIMGGPQTDSTHTLVIEGRNPAVMASYCRVVLGKYGVLSLYLSCGPRVQARRFIAREIDKGLADAADALLGEDTTFQDLKEVGAALSRQASRVTGLETAVRRFTDNQCRDDDDRRRFLALYQFPAALDYRNKALYDIVLDTTDSTPESTLREALTALEHSPVGALMLLRGQAAPAPVAAPGGSKPVNFDDEGKVRSRI